MYLCSFTILSYCIKVTIISMMMMIPCDLESVILCAWSVSRSEAQLWWQEDGGCSDWWSAPPPVKYLTPVTTAYRLSLQPLIPSSGIRGSRNFAISVCLHLLCAQLHFLLCDWLWTIAFFCLTPFFFQVVSLHSCLHLFDYAPPLIISSSFCLHISRLPTVALPLDSLHPSLYPLLLISYFALIFAVSVRSALLSDFTPYLSSRCVNPLLSTPSNNSLHPALLFCHYGYLF